jgi:hypothetical protein
VILPRDFRLCIVSADLTMPVACVWQQQPHAGLRFTGVGTVGHVDNSPLRGPIGREPLRIAREAR